MFHMITVYITFYYNHLLLFLLASLGLHFMRKAVNGAAAAHMSQSSYQELESDHTSSSSRCQLALPCLQ